MRLKFTIIIILTISFFEAFSQHSDTLTFDKYNNQHLGLFAPNFRFVINGANDTLSLYDIKTDSLIILFYDPDCSHCRKEIKKLRKDKKLNCLIERHSVRVLTIPPDITLDEWKKSVRRMPDNWINAFSLDNDVLIRKYLWKVPEMFVLDRDKRIIGINMYREEYDD
ncbi:MAG: thioredoxin family protein [Bacteroidales bacterium]|nr:thioredoxin family protein [Bacteroidales bacterium]